MSQVSSFYGYPQSNAVQSATSSYNNPSQKVLRDGYKLVYSSGSSHHYQAVEKAFKNFIETLYGDQTSLLKQLEPAQQKDRGYTPSYNCEVLLKDENPVGFVVYKNKLTSTHAEDKECNSLELRHLQLLDVVLGLAHNVRHAITSVHIRCAIREDDVLCGNEHRYLATHVGVFVNFFER